MIDKQDKFENFTEYRAKFSVPSDPNIFSKFFLRLIIKKLLVSHQSELLLFTIIKYPTIFKLQKFSTSFPIPYKINSNNKTNSNDIIFYKTYHCNNSIWKTEFPSHPSKHVHVSIVTRYIS